MPPKPFFGQARKLNEAQPPSRVETIMETQKAVTPNNDTASQPREADEEAKVAKANTKKVTTASQPQVADEAAKMVNTNSGTASQPQVVNTNSGTASSFNCQGDGNDNISGVIVNSGTKAGNSKKFHTENNYGGRTVNNSGTFNGHGNGGFIDGNFDASTRNYY